MQYLYVFNVYVVRALANFHGLPFLPSSTVQDVDFLDKSSGDCVQNIFLWNSVLNVMGCLHRACSSMAAQGHPVFSGDASACINKLFAQRSRCCIIGQVCYSACGFLQTSLL